MMFFYMLFLGFPFGLNASVIISPSHDYTTFENNSSAFTFNCSGNETLLFWKVDGQSIYNKSLHGTRFITSPDGLTVFSQLIVPTTKANNNITVICIVQNSLSFNHQSSNPVKLYLQGVLSPPQQFKMYVSNSSVYLFWVAPDSLQVSTAPTISHYILSNNISNSTKKINNPPTCTPLVSCSHELDLRDPFFTCVGSCGGENTTILDYNGAVEFTLFAVNGAGNGNATTCLLQRKTPLGVKNYPSQTVTSAENGPNNTTASSTPNVITLINATAVVAVGILLCISISMLIIFVQYVRKQKSSPIATIDTQSAINNEYVAQSTFVTQVDDPYFVHVPLHLYRSRTNNQNRRKRSQLNQEDSIHL